MGAGARHRRVDAAGAKLRTAANARSKAAVHVMTFVAFVVT